MKIFRKIEGFVIIGFFNAVLGMFLWVVKYLVRPERQSEKIKKMYNGLKITEDDMSMLVEEYLIDRIPIGNFFILHSLNEYYKD